MTRLTDSGRKKGGAKQDTRSERTTVRIICAAIKRTLLLYLYLSIYRLLKQPGSSQLSERHHSNARARASVGMNASSSDTLIAGVSNAADAYGRTLSEAGATSSASTSDGDELDPTVADTGGWIIIAIFGWLTPHVFISIAEARWQIATSAAWKKQNRDDEGSSTLLDEGMRVIACYSSLAIVLCLIVYTATAIGVSLGTRDMDTRMLYILSGLSRIGAACFVFIISVRIPR